jgi:HEPN domain-containing protein
MSEFTEDDRTTALGLFNYARSYRASADCLLQNRLKVPHPHAPVSFLYYHAIELYLKAHLRSQGLTVAQLRKVGHNVGKLAGEVQARGLVLDDEDKEVLQSMSEADNVIRSRYIQTGAYTRPEEEALSRTCAALEEQVAGAFAKSGIVILPALTAVTIVPSIDTNSVTEELSELNAKEREIISYLLHRNERMFTADMDGGHAGTLIARGIVKSAVRPGQVFDPTDMPMEIPRAIWNVIKELKDQFPYSGDEDDPYPWRVGFYDRL